MTGHEKEHHDSAPRMPDGGRYAGKPVDVSSRRSVQIRANGIEEHDTHVVVDYFYHDEVFWTARIPLNGVDHVFGQAFNFSAAKTRQGPQGPEVIYDKSGLPKRKIPMLNHVQSRFLMKQDHCVELFPLHSEPGETPVHRIHDFVYSIEAVGPFGVGFNVRDGLSGSLLSAHRVYSTRQMVFERIVVENQHVTETPALPITKETKRTLLAHSLVRSHRAGMNEAYYLFRICGTNNCTSTPFRILDEVVEYNWLQRIGSILYRFPLNPRWYLRIRGLDSDPTVRRMLRHEFEDYVQAEDTQKRKREFVRRWARLRREAKAGNNVETSSQ